MRTLVIGGAGLVGSNVARALLTEYDDEVVILDLAPISKAAVLAEMQGDIAYVRGSVSDATQLFRVMKDYRVEAVVHCASVFGPASIERPIEALQVNIVGSATVLEVARLLGVGRVVIMSSSTVMGSPDDLQSPRKETDVVLPITGIYPLSKLAVEQIVNTYRKIYSVDAAAVRPRAVYGPGASRDDLTIPVHAMVSSAINGKSFHRPYGADSGFDLTYVKDLVGGTLAALKKPGSLRHHVYNISFGQNVKLGDLAKIITQEVPDADIALGPGQWGGMVSGDQHDMTYRGSLRPPQDVTRAREELGYLPAWPIQRAVPDLIRWLRTGSYGPLS